MSQNTKIQWTDRTWNLVWGCHTKCPYCYAEKIAKRFAKPMAERESMTIYGKIAEYFTEQTENRIRQFIPTRLHSQQNPKFPKKPMRIFCNSMSDIGFWDYKWIKELIVAAKKYPQQTFQILTKFPDILKNTIRIYDLSFPDNVWLGMTAENQENLSERFPAFSEIKAGKHFISFEPMQGEIDLEHLNWHNNSFYQILKPLTNCGDSNRIAPDWIIIGCQTGQNRVKIDNAHILRLILQIKQNSNIPVFVKQIEIDGKIVKDNLPEEFNFREFP